MSVILMEPSRKKAITDDAISVAAFCQGEPIEIPMTRRDRAKNSLRASATAISTAEMAARVVQTEEDYLYFEIKFYETPTTENK